MQQYVWSVDAQDEAADIDTLLALLVKKRGVDSKQEEHNFNLHDIEKAALRIRSAIERGVPITVYSDYDADGICGVAVLWQTLRDLGAKVMPYIPHREKEGYGLSQAAVEKLHQDGTAVIITVDCGITSSKAVKRAQELGVDVIITDHHVAPSALPPAFALVHDTTVCGAAVAWKLAQVLTNHKNPSRYLDLVAIATIGDLVPLTGENRLLARSGLSVLNKTSAVGLEELIASAGLMKGALGTYEVGYMLVPRINALGRLDHAIDALRLLCTANRGRARQLAQVLSDANARRQQLTIQGVEQALEQAKLVDPTQPIIVMANSSWQQGIIGLIAGKLAEHHYRPAVIMSQGEMVSKGSCRSVPGFNIVQALRLAKDLLIDVGGHPMAAGFTIETGNIAMFRDRLQKIAQDTLSPEILKRRLYIDATIPLSLITIALHEKLRVFEPFGIGNPEPVFVSSGLRVATLRTVGNGGKHLKLSIVAPRSQTTLDAIAFGRGELASTIQKDSLFDFAYTIAPDTWNGRQKMQLKVKDMREASLEA